ncbi:MAG: GtrA family protein [Halobacteriaceae archaeon]
MDLETEWVEALVAPRRAGQFLSVGILGAIVDMVVLTTVVELGGVSPAVGKVLSAEAAIVVMFVANEGWTFTEYGQSGLRPLVGRFLRSNVVRATGAGVAWVVLVALIEWIGVWYLLANAVGIGAGAVVNYVAETLLTWRVHR